MPKRHPVVFVHGWSVRDTESYGALPERLAREARANAVLDLDVRHVWLSEYVSFHDEVRVADLARAFDAAVERDLGDLLTTRQRFVCITHSTGGPILREWLQRNFVGRPERPLPISHLIMLAPPSYGSALAQLGKTQLARLKAWFEGVEPGTGVLDWLELGSPESLALNRAWIESGRGLIGARGVFPFVLQGESIDRALYDHLVPYTAENGSDGVVRVASANPNTRWLTLEQGEITRAPTSPLDFAAPRLRQTGADAIDGVAMRIIKGRAHSGEGIGIMRSVKNDAAPDPTVDAIMRCLAVRTQQDYDRLAGRFASESRRVQAAEQVEHIDGSNPFERTIIRDPATMIVFRVRDDHGHPVKDYDLKLIAGKTHSPDHLPPGFFIDRQRNKRCPNTITYFLNWSRMAGATPVFDMNGTMLREALKASPGLGISIMPYPLNGFVHYLPAMWPATQANMKRLIARNQTTVVDIVLRRVVGSGTFRLTQKLEPESFVDVQPGAPIGLDAAGDS
ncbi:MAG TPA: alpha/beta hydrolase [Gammaproteobacteria bacterium]|nr:alpha/beta hydrolase [Gammaproteobacteria bacterium]